MLNIVLFGPPGAGKGTQAVNVIEKYKLMHLSTGDMLRAAKAAGTELGKRVAAIMDAGNLVSDEIVIALIEERLQQNPDAAGFIFDGFPRTIPQAEALDALLNANGNPINICVSMAVDEEELVTRLLKRAEDQGRADDTREVIQNRIKEYTNKTLPVASYYGKQGKLANINGIGSVEEIFERISAVLDSAK
ncbi:MAG: adenylate kinase [Bacteroidia bacterium]|nr:adenylate kinase [Bacteroidia bacterium]